MSGLPFANIRERGGYYVDKTLLNLGAEMAKALRRMCNRERLENMKGRVILIGMAFKDGIPRAKVGSMTIGGGSP